jgi:hypothetical protein
MKRALRIILGVAIVGVVLRAADLATRDCRLAPYVYDNCMWVWLRTHLSLPASRFLRMAALECVGVVLALILFVTFRYVFPWRGKCPAAPESAPPLASDPPRS